MSAKQKYDELMKDCEEPSPIERLRFYCSLAMSGQDWLDVEPFINALAPPSAQAIETAAIRMCVEVCDRHARSNWNDDRRAQAKLLRDEILALISKDGRTALEGFGMKVAEAIRYRVSDGRNIEPDDFRSIVNQVMKEVGK